MQIDLLSVDRFAFVADNIYFWSPFCKFITPIRHSTARNINKRGRGRGEVWCGVIR